MVGAAPLIRLAPLAADWRVGVCAGAACAVCSGSLCGCCFVCALAAGAGCGFGAGLGAGFGAEATGADGAGFSSSPVKKLFTLPNSPPLSEDVDAQAVRAGAGADFDSEAAIM